MSRLTDLMRENRAIMQIERDYFEVDTTYIAGEQYEYKWKRRQIPIVINLYKNGASIYEIARAFKRHPSEVVILILDLGDQGLLSSDMWAINYMKSRVV